MVHMNPSEQKPSYSPDYLNQIAIKPQGKFHFSQLQMIIFGGVSLVLVLIALITVINIVNGPNRSFERLMVRLQSTEIIVGDSQAKLNDTELRSLNSSLKIYLTNANRDITPLLSKERITNMNHDTTIAREESGSNISARLEDARLNAVFDRTYTREMSYLLETTITLLRQLYSSSSSASTKDFLNTTINNFVPVQKSFEDFQDTSGWDRKVSRLKILDYRF